MSTLAPPRTEPREATAPFVVVPAGIDALEKAAERLAARGDVVHETWESAHAGGQPYGGVVIGLPLCAEDCARSAAHRVVDDVWHQLVDLLPDLAEPAHVLLVVTRPSGSKRPRKLLVEMGHALEMLERRASTDHGLPLTVNAVDLGSSCPADRMAAQICQLIRHRSLVASGIVVDCAELDGDTLVDAILAEAL